MTLRSIDKNWVHLHGVSSKYPGWPRFGETACLPARVTGLAPSNINTPLLGQTFTEIVNGKFSVYCMVATH